MKRILALLAVCAMLLPLMALAETLGEGSRRVFDDANLMETSEISKLEETIASLRKRYNMDIVVLTSKDAPTDRSLAFADDFYDNNGFGMGDDFSGFLFFIDMHNRIPTITTTGLMIRYVTDTRLNALLDTAYAYLSKSQYGQGAYMVLAQLSVYLQNGIPAGQHSVDEYGNADPYIKPRSLTGGEIGIALLAALACGLGLFLAVRYRYAMKGSAYQYDVRNNTTVTITGATDVYLRTQVSRVPRASSGSGGAMGGRSSTHRSSSGRSHGGGSGRRF